MGPVFISFLLVLEYALTVVWVSITRKKTFTNDFMVQFETEYNRAFPPVMIDS